MSASELGEQAEKLEAWGEMQKTNLEKLEKRVAGYLTQISRAHEIIRETESALKSLREEISGSFHEYQDKVQAAIGMSIELRKELARLEAIQHEAREAMNRGDRDRADKLADQVCREHDALEPTFNNVNVEIRAAGKLSSSIHAAGKRADQLARPELAKRKSGGKKAGLTNQGGGGWSFRKKR